MRGADALEGVRVGEPEVAALDVVAVDVGPARGAGLLEDGRVLVEHVVDGPGDDVVLHGRPAAADVDDRVVLVLGRVARALVAGVRDRHVELGGGLHVGREGTRGPVDAGGERVARKLVRTLAFIGALGDLGVREGVPARKARVPHGPRLHEDFDTLGFDAAVVDRLVGALGDLLGVEHVLELREEAAHGHGRNAAQLSRRGELVAPAFLGLEVGIAVVVRALARVVEAVDELAHLGRLVARGDAALEAQGLHRLPDEIGTGRCVRAEDVAPHHAAAHRGGPLIIHEPFALDEGGELRLVECHSLDHARGRLVVDEGLG